MARKKVLVVDTQQIMLGLIRSLLKNEGYEVAVAASSAEALHEFNTSAPDVLVTNVQIESATAGVQLANALLLLEANLHVVFLSELPDFRSVGITKSQLPPLFAFLNRQRINDPQRLLDAVAAKRRPGALSHFRDDRLNISELSAVSRTQIEVLRLVALGFTNLEIAESRGVTQRAVEALLNRTASALNVNFEPGSNSRIKLARAYIREAGLPI